MHIQSIERRLIAVFMLLAGLVGISLSAHATTYYVRTDGGTATQCNGTANAPVSAAPNCAWSSPTVALPMGDGQYGYVIPAALIKGGDTLQIASGSYMIGYSETPIAGTQGQACNQSNTYECQMSNIPSGIDAAHPTVITGDCTKLPELWGTQRNGSIFNLSGQHDVKIACLELTDHSNCITWYPVAAYACNRNTYPYGTWADTGIHADHVTNMTLQNLNIHGFADQAMNAGALSGNTVLDHVIMRGNGWSGWNGDLGGNNATSTNSGNITIKNSDISWNGCTENYPSTTIFNCWGQQEGGYGDGLGMAQTGGNWKITNTTVIGNTQDGIDLLYADGTGSIFIDGVTSMWNAGNQIKASGNTTIQNSVVVGNCGYLKGWGTMSDPDLCRASGAALSINFTATNQTINVLYNTVAGSGDCLINGGTHGGFNAPNATDVYNYQNNVFLGANYWRAGRSSCLDWYTDAATIPETVNYLNNIVWNVKANVCPAGSICKDPQLTSEDQSAFNATPLVSSPAVGNASAAGMAVPLDYYGNARPSQGATIGAVQYNGSTPSQSGTPAASFTYAVSGLTANFTDASADTGGSIGSWSWSFGDGATSSVQSPSHAYAAAGTYAVSLTVADKASGKTSTYSANVTVAAQQPVGGTPVASFGFTTSGLTANFTDASTDNGGSLGAWAWSFGDGTSSSAQNPNHAYAAAGSYTVSLTVTDKANGKTSMRTAQVTVTAPQPVGGTPTANFTFVYSGLTVSFTDTSTDQNGKIGSWLWAFGDGTTSNSQNPTHTYPAGGTYTATLTVTDSVSGKTSSKSVTGTLTAPQPVGGTPAANFTYNTSGLTASFVDTSTDTDGSIGSWSWSFGDGASSSAQGPSHTYAAAGAYQVSVTVTDKVSGKTSTYTARITVTAPQLAGGTPNADFTHRVSGLAANFNDTSTDNGGTLDSWLWSFGDGATSSGRRPRHAYRGAGNYTVTLTVRDRSSGRTATTSHVVSITKVSRVCFLGYCF